MIRRRFLVYYRRSGERGRVVQVDDLDEASAARQVIDADPDVEVRSVVDLGLVGCACRGRGCALCDPSGWPDRYLALLAACGGLWGTTPDEAVRRRAERALAEARRELADRGACSLPVERRARMLFAVAAGLGDRW